MAGISKPHRINRQITIVAGTPERLVSKDTPVPVYANRLFIQSRAANTGLVYVLGGVPLETVLSAADAAQLTAELGASPSATQPGGSFGDPPGNSGGVNMTPPDDLREWAIDGTHSGDLVIISYDLRN